MQLKAVPVAIKADGEGLADGEFEAVVSVFGNVDSYGDVVMPGAFADTLAERSATGKSFPVVFSHGSSEPENFIGKVVEATETDEGLQIRGVLYETEKAQHVRRLMVDGVLDQFSFAYGVKERRDAERDGVRVTELVKLDLYEVGPTLVGANPATRLLGAKSTVGEKAGRAISAKNEKALTDAKAAMKSAISAIDDVLAANGEADSGKSAERREDEEPSEDKGADAPDDPVEVKSSAAAEYDPRTALEVIQFLSLEGA